MIDFGLEKLLLWSASTACAGIFITQAAEVHPAAFTLNDVMQVPFSSDMLAAPTGAAVAWVFNSKGCSNIWVADPSHGAKARPITPYTEDDGFAIGELAWSPDTKSIAFTRGQSLEDETPANVNNSPEGAMPKEVWVVAMAGGAPHKVGAGDSPSFSPDGSRLLSLAPIPVVIQVLLADQQHILLLSLFLRVNGHEETSGREKESEEKNEPRNRVDNVPEIRWQSC